MTADDKLLAALESLGDRMERLGDRLDVVARAVVANTTQGGKTSSAITAIATDFSHVRDRIEFIAINTKRRKLKAVPG